jgi:hypothetical protein
MRQLIKYFLCIVCLALGVQSSWAFSLLGPVGSAGVTGGGVEDNWQITDLGYDPLPNGGAPPFIGTDGDPFGGPKSIGEGYRFNTPVIYYTFDPDFDQYFGVDGETAVEQAFNMLNGVLNGQTNTPMVIVNPNSGVLMGATNGVFNGPSVVLSPANGLDEYTTNLTEFPVNSQGVNYQAQALGLTDLKSTTLSFMVQQLGLADAVRYTWGLINRYVPGGVTCTPIPFSAGPVFPNGVDYWVIQRNLDIVPSSLTNYQYTPYVNTELYSYFIWETCGPGAPYSPPIADTIPIPADPLDYNQPVASGVIPGEGMTFNDGIYYTGLTRDDVGGLRYLLSTNNILDPGILYTEQPAGGSVLFYTNSSPLAQQLLSTTNYNALYTAALTNSPASLQALFPALTFTNVGSYFSNVVSSSLIFVTNYPIGGVSGQGYIGLQTVYATNIVEFYQYEFENVVTNKIYTNTTYAFQTITVGPPIGSVVGSPFVTNVTYQTFQSNIVSGDYFIITNGFCGPNIIQTLQTNVNVVTNLLSGVTNANGSSIVQNLIYSYTNYVFVVQPCTLLTNAVADYQGIGRIQFVFVDPYYGNYDSQLGTFITPITNQYSMVVITNHQLVTLTFQRVVTRPDIVFSAQSLSQGSGNQRLVDNVIAVSMPNYIDSHAPALGLAGPGIIDPTTTSNISIVFNAIGPAYENTSPNFTGPSGLPDALLNWASFDGTTNLPVVYPNGTSIENLAAEAYYRISPSPPTLPSGTNGVPYNVTLTATGTSGTVSWALAPSSYGLPPGLTLSSAGIISGTPTQSATFDGIVIQMTDVFQAPYSYSPSTNVMDATYSLTIN